MHLRLAKKWGVGQCGDSDEPWAAGAGAVRKSRAHGAVRAECNRRRMFSQLWASSDPRLVTRRSEAPDLILEMAEAAAHRERITEEKEPRHREGDEDVPVRPHRSCLWGAFGKAAAGLLGRRSGCHGMRLAKRLGDGGRTIPSLLGGSRGCTPEREERNEDDDDSAHWLNTPCVELLGDISSR
jgi:hypothetical protein